MNTVLPVSRQAAWKYRVVCEDGAFVRAGLELSSRHLYTISSQDVVEVTERCINNQGLARLRTHDGWISEMLNPLSGQRGPIVEQVCMNQPFKFRVTYEGGALVRSGVELSSSVVGTIPAGQTIVITEKRFSNSPSYRCVPRLKLADGSGWISMRINSPPPDDIPVVEWLGVAESEDVGDFTLLGAAVNGAGSLGERDMSIITDGILSEREVSVPDTLSSSTAPQPSPFVRHVSLGIRPDRSCSSDKIARAITDISLAMDESNSKTLAKDIMDATCLVCFSEPRTATFVHGETGHIACCLECARVLKGRGDPCPVCRCHVDAVIQHFWA